MKRKLLLLGGLLILFLACGLIYLYSISSKIKIINRSNYYTVAKSNEILLALAVLCSGIFEESGQVPLYLIESGKIQSLNIFIVDQKGEIAWEMGENPDTGELTTITATSHVYDPKKLQMNLSIYVSPDILGKTVNADNYYREKVESAFLQGLFKSKYVTDYDRETFHKQMDRYLNIFANKYINFLRVKT